MIVPAWQVQQRAALLEEIPSGIMLLDRSYKIIDHNRAFGEMFGESRGQTCYRVTKRRMSPCRTCAVRETFTDGEVRIIEEKGCDRSGKPADYLVQVTPLRDAGEKISHVAAITTDLTATRRLQREYQVLFERVPCYVAVLNRNYRVVKANEMFRRVFGEPTGERCYRLFKKSNTPCADCPAAQTFKDGASHTARHVGISQEGMPTHYVVSTAPLLLSDGEAAHVIEMCLDVTEAHELTLQLTRANVLREALIEHSLDAIVVLDAAGKVLLLNRAAEELCGFSRPEAVGRKVPPRLLPPEVRRLLRGRADQLLLPESVIGTAAGEQIPVRLAGIALYEEGQRLGTALIVQDMRKIKELEQANLEAERLAAVGQTVAGLAHGIKNILTGLEGGMYVCSTGLKKSDESRIARGWQMLERNMGRISELARNLLAFSRGEVLKPVLTDPADLVHQAVDLFLERAGQHDIDLTTKTESGIAPAMLDPEGIRSCLDNLISNAIDACLVSPKAEGSIMVGLQEERGCLVLEVADTGCGMDYEVRQKAFTSFFTTKGAGGTGLGLLMTRKIVQQHGGTVSFKSTAGEGTTFRIILPRKRLPTPEAPESGQSAGQSPRPSKEKQPKKEPSDAQS